MVSDIYTNLKPRITPNTLKADCCLLIWLTFQFSTIYILQSSGSSTFGNNCIFQTLSKSRNELYTLYWCPNIWKNTLRIKKNSTQLLLTTTEEKSASSMENGPRDAMRWVRNPPLPTCCAHHWKWVERHLNTQKHSNGTMLGPS